MNRYRAVWRADGWGVLDIQRPSGTALDSLHRTREEARRKARVLNSMERNMTAWKPRFAFLPTKVMGRWLWFRWYESRFYVEGGGYAERRLLLKAS